MIERLTVHMVTTDRHRSYMWVPISTTRGVSPFHRLNILLVMCDCIVWDCMGDLKIFRSSHPSSVSSQWSSISAFSSLLVSMEIQSRQIKKRCFHVEQNSDFVVKYTCFTSGQSCEFLFNISHLNSVEICRHPHHLAMLCYWMCWFAPTVVLSQSQLLVFALLSCCLVDPRCDRWPNIKLLQSAVFNSLWTVGWTAVHLGKATDSMEYPMGFFIM